MNTKRSLVKKIVLFILPFFLYIGFLSPVDDVNAQGPVQPGVTTQQPGVTTQPGTTQGPVQPGVTTQPGATTQQQGATTSPQSQNSGAATQDPETTCAVEKVGWIVCPIIEASATIGDKLFAFLANNFLQTEPELVSNDEGNGTITAWGIARNLANVMFIIAFLIIIYSQVTGAGISNYGLKRMLPRLIVAAIAVNISYYICQGMVDLSNILGFEIKKALVDIAGDVSSQHVLASSSGNGSNTQTADGSLGTIAKAILVVGGIVWIAIAMFGPMLGLVVITCIVIIIILLLRKAFIVLLVVASPIAFVAYLLPNTEKYFSKWLNMFWQLLMVFPIVALLFGGGQLASSIILAAGMKNTNMYKIEGEGCVNLQQVANNANPNSSQSSTTTTSPPGTTCGTSEGPGWMLAMVAAGIAVAPLLAVWSVLKGALAAAGAIGGKIAGAVQKGTSTGVGKLSTPLGAGKKALQKRMGENTQAAWQRAQARGLSGEAGRLSPSRIAGRVARRSADRATRLAVSKDDFERNRSTYMNSDAVQQAASRGLSENGQRRALARAAGAETKEQREAIDASSALLEQSTGGNLDDLATALTEAVQNGDMAGAIAAQKMFMEAGEGGARAFKTAMSQLDTAGLSNSRAVQGMRRNITTQQSEIKGKNADIYSWASNDDADGGYRGVSDTRHFNVDGLTDAQVASQRNDVLAGAIQQGSLNGQRAYRITTNDSVMANAKGAQQTTLRNQATTRPQQPPNPPPNP